MKTRAHLDMVDPESMSLLGLMMGRIIENNLAIPDLAKRAGRLRGKLGITAGKMSLTLNFDQGVIHLIRGLDSGLKASVSGSLAGLLSVSLGKGPVQSFLAGDVSFTGNPFFVLKVLPLFCVQSDK